RYYQEKVKPLRQMKPPRALIKCYFCSMYRQPSSYDGPMEGGILWKFGPRAQNAMEGDEYTQKLALSYVQAVDLVLVEKCLRFLKHGLSMGYITKERIISYFELQVAREAQKAREAHAARETSSPGLLEILTARKVMAPAAVSRPALGGKPGGLKLQEVNYG
ncbi:unnamed protein product, partial [marine sediment metagenome]